MAVILFDKLLAKATYQSIFSICILNGMSFCFFDALKSQ